MKRLCGAAASGLKMRYNSKEEAELEMRAAQVRRSKGKTRGGHRPKRVYECDSCQGWHMTHK